MSTELGPRSNLLIEKFSWVLRNLENRKLSSDIDGVEINSAEKAVKKLNKIFGTNHTIRSLTNYWSMVDLVAAADPSIKDPKAYAINLWNAEDVFGPAEPAPGAWLVSDYINRNRIPIKFHRITSRPSHVAEITRNWYRHKMPWINPDLIHLRTQGVLDDRTAGFKIDTINKFGIELHWEDSWEEAEAIVRNTKATVILVPAPWNKDYRVQGGHAERIILPSVEFEVGAPNLVAVFLDLYKRI